MNRIQLLVDLLFRSIRGDELVSQQGSYDLLFKDKTVTSRPIKIKTTKYVFW